MTAVQKDAYGLEVSTSDRAAVDAYDRGVRALLGFGADTVECFRAAVAADPDFALARGGLAVSLYLMEKIPEGRAQMELATGVAASLPPRERRHVEALALWVAGRANEALPLMKALLAEHPRDLLLMQRLYFIYFWQGRSAEMLELTESVRPALAGRRLSPWHPAPAPSTTAGRRRRRASGDGRRESGSDGLGLDGGCAHRAHFRDLGRSQDAGSPLGGPGLALRNQLPQRPPGEHRLNGPLASSGQAGAGTAPCGGGRALRQGGAAIDVPQRRARGPWPAGGARSPGATARRC